MITPSQYSVTAFVIRRRSVGEGDKILTLFTKQYGKKRVIAKGIRKVGSRRAPHLELFTQSKVNLHKAKTLDIVTDASSIHLYGNLCTSLESVAMLYYIMEVVDGLTVEQDPHQDVFSLLEITCQAVVSQKPSDAVAVLIHFSDTMLSLLGFRAKGVASRDFPFAIASLESVLERKLRSVKLLRKSGLVF